MFRSIWWIGTSELMEGNLAMSTETIAILRAVCDQIEDAIEHAKKTIEPKVIAGEEERNWRLRRAYEGPSERDGKRDVWKYWPELVPLSLLHARVQGYMNDVQGLQGR